LIKEIGVFSGVKEMVYFERVEGTVFSWVRVALGMWAGNLFLMVSKGLEKAATR